MKKISCILAFVFIVVSLFASTFTAQAANVKSAKKAKYYKTASTKKRVGIVKKGTALDAKSMAKGFVKFKIGKKNVFIKVTDVKITGKFNAKVVKKTNVYNNKGKATKIALKKGKELTISGMVIKKKVAYLKYASGRYIKATDIKVLTFFKELTTTQKHKSTLEPTLEPTIAPTAEPVDNDVRLIVKGKDITEGNHVKVVFVEDLNTQRIELPFVAIMKALGAEVTWKDEYTAEMRYNGEEYTLDSNKHLFCKKGDEHNLLIPAPGTINGYYKAVSYELIIQDAFLLHFFIFNNINIKKIGEIIL